MTKAKMTFHRAIDLLRCRDARLIQTNNKGGPEFWIVLGGKVEPEMAARLIAHPQVRGGKDSLFPGLDQTYRIGGE
jgi:hypothetical protein